MHPLAGDAIGATPMCYDFLSLLAQWIYRCKSVGLQTPLQERQKTTDLARLRAKIKQPKHAVGGAFYNSNEGSFNELQIKCFTCGKHEHSMSECLYEPFSGRGGGSHNRNNGDPDDEENDFDNDSSNSSGGGSGNEPNSHNPLDKEKLKVRVDQGVNLIASPPVWVMENCAGC